MAVKKTAGDMVALKGNKEIGDHINKITGALAEENDLKGAIDVADFNDEDRLGRGKEMCDRPSKPGTSRHLAECSPRLRNLGKIHRLKMGDTGLEPVTSSL